MTDKQIMQTTEEKSQRASDFFKWGIASLLLICGIVFDLNYNHQSMMIRLAVWVGVLGGIFAFVSQTTQIAKLVEFAKLSQNELKRVVWPTRQETVQTAMIVAVVVFVLGMLLWGVDGILLWLVGLLTGQRG